jgi:hypothetical protein
MRKPLNMEIDGKTVPVNWSEDRLPTQDEAEQIVSAYRATQGVKKKPGFWEKAKAIMAGPAVSAKPVIPSVMGALGSPDMGATVGAHAVTQLQPRSQDFDPTSPNYQAALTSGPYNPNTPAAKGLAATKTQQPSPGPDVHQSLDAMNEHLTWGIYHALDTIGLGDFAANITGLNGQYAGNPLKHTIETFNPLSQMFGAGEAGPVGLAEGLKDSAVRLVTGKGTPDDVFALIGTGLPLLHAAAPHIIPEVLKAGERFKEQVTPGAPVHAPAVHAPTVPAAHIPEVEVSPWQKFFDDSAAAVEATRAREHAAKTVEAPKPAKAEPLPAEQVVPKAEVAQPPPKPPPTQAQVNPESPVKQGSSVVEPSSAPYSNFSGAEAHPGLPADPLPHGTKQTALTITRGQARILYDARRGQRDLASVLAEGKTRVYHETDTKGAQGLLGRMEASNATHSGVYVADDPGLALGQKGAGVRLEIDPSRINGREVDTKPGQEFASAVGGGEYVFDKSLPGAVTALEFKTKAQLNAFAKEPKWTSRFDFENVTKTDYGYRADRKGTYARNSAPELPAEQAPPAEAPAATAPVPVETNQALPDGATGPRNAITEAERTARGEEPIDLGKAQGREAGYNEAKVKVDSGEINPESLTEKINKQKHTASSEDTHALAYHRALIKAEYEKIGRQIDDAISKGDLEEAARLHDQQAEWSAKFDANDQALRIAGRQWHEAGQARRSVILKDYSSPQDMVKEYERAVGRPATKGETQRIENLAKEHKRLSDEITRLEAENKGLKDSKQAREARKTVRAEQAQVLDQEYANLRRALDAQRQKGSKKIGRSTKSGSVNFTPDQAAIVGRMVHNRVKRLGVSVAEAVDHVHSEVSQVFHGAERGDVHDAYQHFLKSPEAKAKTRRGRVADLLDGEVEAGKKNGRLGRYVTEFGRMNALSSYNVFGKLAAATGGHGVITPVEELLGPAIGKLPGLKNAGTETAFSAKAVGAFVKEFVNPASTVDAFRKLFTGMNSLDARAADIGLTGEKITSNPILVLAQNSHGALKTFAQRASFAKEMVKGLREAKAGGLDLSNPDVQAQVFAEAYGASKRDIFMGDSFQSKLASQIINPPVPDSPVKSAYSTAARLAMPVVKVPLNYAGRAAEYAFPPYALLRHVYEWGWRRAAGEGAIPKEVQSNIVRAYKRAGVGAGLAYTAYVSSKDEVRVNDKGHLVLFNKELPSALTHIPWFEALRMGALFRDTKGSKGEKAYGAAFNTGTGIITHTPLFDVPRDIVQGFRDQKSFEDAMGAFARGVLVPQLMQQIARNQDVDASGESVQRKPSGIKEQMQSGIPDNNLGIPSRRQLHEKMTLSGVGVKFSDAAEGELSRLGLGVKPPKQGKTEPDAAYHKRVGDKMKKYSDAVNKVIALPAYRNSTDKQKTNRLKMIRGYYGMHPPD